MEWSTLKNIIKLPKKIVTAILIAIIIISLSCLKLFSNQETGTEISSDVIRGGANNIVKWGDKGSFVFLTAEDPVHICIVDKRLMSLDFLYYNPREKITDDTKWNIDIYDLSKRRITKETINLKSELNKFDAEKSIVQVGNFSTYGNHFLVELISTTKDIGSSIGDSKIYFDIETKKFVEGNDIVEKNRFFPHNFEYLLELKYLNIISMFESEFFKVDQDGRFVEIDLDALNKQDINLKSIIGKIGKYNKDKTIYLYVQDDLTNKEETFQMIRHWLAPRGKDKLEVFVTDPRNGEKTAINSLADYNMWKESHTELFTKWELQHGK